MNWGFQLGQNLYSQVGTKPITAYKYLKSPDLKFWLIDETIKIDTLSNYAGIESIGGVGDPQELTYKDTTSFYTQEEHGGSLLETNLRTLIGKKAFKSNSFFVSNKITLANKYIYCLSSRFDKESFQSWRKKEDYDCVIRIRDLSRFLLEVQKADIIGEKRLGAPAYLDLVEYVKTPIDLEEYYLADEYKWGMIKDTEEFKWQSELRVRWPLSPATDSSPYFLRVPNLSSLIEVMSIPKCW
ncbi:hypothetical protein [Marisediminitalea sp.]|uniref:hypothetical protein n=1 Tax=Marisediminitalea sp. TaxID=2662268 RepID=UPI0035174351